MNLHDPTTKAAQALSPLLSPLGRLSEQRLDSVWALHIEGSLDRLVLRFGPAALIIKADPDEDTIEFSVSDSCDPHADGCIEADKTEPWRSLIGKPFGWGWVTINQQGYCDGLLLSFEGIYPGIVLNVIASSIKIGLITALGKAVE
jgi:Family of unknown function (DUF6334)